MSHRVVEVYILLIAVGLVGCASPEPESDGDGGEESPQEAETLRVATFNASLYRGEEGRLVDDLAEGDDEQARKIAAAVQVVRPDVILINEFDYDDQQAAAESFAEDFLAESQGGREAIEYPHYRAFRSNTGVASGRDLDDNGTVGDQPGTEEYAGDAFGYGLFPGQYGFAVFSKYPLEVDERRTFREFLWRDMPDSLMPDDYYGDEERDVFRLSSKNHVDLPVEVGDHRLHLLASHPTPPLESEHQRNMRRNQDEIRLWNDYIHPDRGDYLYDDQGTSGGLGEEEHFVIAGDLNADRHESDEAGYVADLLDDPRVEDPEPTSPGARVAGPSGGDEEQRARHTADFNSGDMRVDYVLPSSNLTVEDAGVFWPEPGEENADLLEASDHRLVWVDLEIGVE